jgi:two-component system LytT family response regulator
MRVLLIDDEPLARRELRRLLAPNSWIDVTGEAANVDEAVRQIDALRPELVFLDIQMPGGTGFDVLERVLNVPQVIFTTAYDQHALRAFEVNALDYLLKPVEPERLAAALSRVRRSSVSAEAPLDQLFVRDGAHCWLVPLREVQLIESEGNYVRLCWGKHQPLLGRSLSSFEARLDPRRFFRANRQQLVNIDFIERIEPGLAGRLHVQLRAGPEVEVSRRQARLFKARLGG